MKVPLSWLKEFVEITISPAELAHLLTIAGLEVEELTIFGLPMPEAGPRGMASDTRLTGLAWEADKIVTAAVAEVMPHPNADRLVLCRLFDGEQEHIVLTGAPNLYPYKGLGALPQPLKVAYAKEGARIYDGHQPGQVLTTLKRAKIRGVESYSMICSEKELGITDEHEGVIILDADAPLGMPLADYMGDAVFNINILPNIARDANILGVAREVAAITGKPLRIPDGFFDFKAEGSPIQGKVKIEIQVPELNPRFVLAMIEGVRIGESPYWMQRRLKLAGMRPISNIVDITNYVMLEVGEPLHAFDYDVLVQRAGGTAPTILTRTAAPGERLTTLDGVERQLDPFTVLVCDTAGALSIAGVMGGAESEVQNPSADAPGTTNILLEGAAWNYINIRRTVAAQKLQSEAAYRFARGVHPAMAERGVRRAIELMRQLAGGAVSQGVVDNYPLPPVDPSVTFTAQDVRRSLGIDLTLEEITRILESLGFTCRIEQSSLSATAPDHRLDIGEGTIGRADVMEEIARIYGYDRIPETRLADTLPVQRTNTQLDREERLRDILVALGLQETVSYRLTSPERELRRLAPGTPPEDKPYVRLVNPITSDRLVLRHSLISSLLENAERNTRLQERMAIFEIGPIYLAAEAGSLPDELLRLGILLTGPRHPAGWQPADRGVMDFFDLKGMLETLFDQLHLPETHYEAAEHPTYHPGKCAWVMCGEKRLGVMGEMHPQVQQQYDLPATPVLLCDLDLDAALSLMLERYDVQEFTSFPPVLEDLAIVVDEDIPAGRVAELIRQAGGRTVAGVRLFDIYRSEQIGAGKKSMAYSLTYQAPDRTLTDKDVAAIRQRILRRLEQELQARLRS